MPASTHQVRHFLAVAAVSISTIAVSSYYMSSLDWSNTIAATQDDSALITTVKPTIISAAAATETTTAAACFNDELCRIVASGDKAQLWEYAKKSMSKPATLTCNDRRRIGKDVGSLDQEPYSICFDKPYALTTGDCLVYSFGIANEWDFDDQMGLQYKCQVLSFDPSMNLNDGYQRPNGVTFYKLGLWLADMTYIPDGSEIYGNKNPSNWTMLTLKSVAKRFKHENKRIDILKIDIEGSETKGVLQALADGFLQSNVATLTLEWHMWNFMKDNATVLMEILTAHERLAASGFETFHTTARTVADGFFPQESYVNRNLFGKAQN